MCWLYSMPNLLVIQHLKTMYLGGNNVRVVFESVKNWSSVCIKRQLVIGSRDWLTNGDLPECGTPVKHARSWRVRTTESLQDKKYCLAVLLFDDWNSQLIPVASDSSCFTEKWLFKFLLIPYYKYPYTHEMYSRKESFQRESWEKTLEKNKIDPSTILYIWFSKFLYSHPLYCHIHERIIDQILTSPNSE